MNASPGVRTTMLTVHKQKQRFLSKMINGSCIFDQLKVTLWYFTFHILLWGVEFSWFQLLYLMNQWYRKWMYHKRCLILGPQSHVVWYYIIHFMLTLVTWRKPTTDGLDHLCSVATQEINFLWLSQIFQ